MSNRSFAYPADRDWGVDKDQSFNRYTSLAEGWNTSRDILANIKRVLTEIDLENSIKTLAVAGSLGRMEASQSSDCDLIVILNDNIKLDSQAATKATEAIWNALETLKIDKPKPTGVFAKPTNIEQLCSPKSVGKSEEDLTVFGKRLLLLMESQPVYNQSGYEQTIESIVDDLYAKRHVALDPAKEWSFLINDLVRYFRSLCVNYQWDYENENGKWPLRNIKLRHSRVIMYAGLLALLGECGKEREDKVRAIAP